MENKAHSDRSPFFGIAPPELLVSPRDDPPRHDGCLLIYAAQGAPVILDFPEESIRLGPNDICILPPDAPHGFRNAGTLACIAIESAMLLSTFVPLLADCPLLLEFMVQCHYFPKRARYIHFRHRDGEKAQAWIDRVFSEFDQKRISYRSALTNAVAELFVTLTRNYAATAPADGMSPEVTLNLILGYLSAHSSTATLEATAKYFSYHPNSISSILHRNLGKGFSEVLRDLRMERARVLLTRTSLPVSEVASLCGYEHMTHFYKLFKNQFGLTPKSYSAAAGRARTLGVQ